MTDHEARREVKKRLKAKYGTLAALAHQRGCRSSYISYALANLLPWILAEAGLIKVVTYEERPCPPRPTSTAGHATRATL